MPAAVDTGQEAGLSNTGDKDRDLQVLFQELCQLQAKYELSQAPPCPLSQPQGHLQWAKQLELSKKCLRSPGQEMNGEGTEAWE